MKYFSPLFIIRVYITIQQTTHLCLSFWSSIKTVQYFDYKARYALFTHRSITFNVITCRKCSDMKHKIPFFFHKRTVTINTLLCNFNVCLDKQDLYFITCHFYALWYTPMEIFLGKKLKEIFFFT